MVTCVFGEQSINKHEIVQFSNNNDKPHNKCLSGDAEKQMVLQFNPDLLFPFHLPNHQ